MSLYTRLKGGDIGVKKIPIHAFIGALGEFYKGHMTGQEVIEMFDLEGDEVQDAIWLKDLMTAAPDKPEFRNTLKELLYMAETGRRFLTQAEFTTRAQAIVTDQGGVVFN